MTSHQDAGPDRPDGAGAKEADEARRGARLDEDPEALEDPVHCGDAHHQHDLRATPQDRGD